MKLSLLLAVLLAAFTRAASEDNASGSLASWLATEQQLALKGVLANIGGRSSKVAGAGAGIVVASPSKTSPNYFYTWTRDSALTLKCLIDRFIAGDTELASIIDDYVKAQYAIQVTSNPSGATCSGGLGEPKFNVDLTAYSGAWGRPQRDGPALRATALIAYARWLIANDQTSYVRSTIWPLVQNDLSYITQNWNQSTFDLWEEVNSSSFFTTAAQYRSLVEGSALAVQIGETCPHCDSQAPQVLCFLQSYWTGSYILSNTGGGRSGKDANSILSSIHISDPAALCDSNTFQPCSDRALSNHKTVTDSFRLIYNVNQGIPRGKAVAIGRYPEDSYFGGNPWYLTTMAAAEQLYHAISQWDRVGTLSITPISLEFFQDIYPSAAVGTYNAASPQFKDIIVAVASYADGFLSVAQKYTPSDGALAEQFARSDGLPLSAPDLTWSYVAFLTANAARNRTASPATWGAVMAKLPDTCIPTSAKGACSGAVGSCSVSVDFNEIRSTQFGETVLVVGSIPQLGNWDPASAITLSADQYSSSDPRWHVVVDIPTEVSFQYKYIKQGTDRGITWESDPNRSFTTSNTCGGTATIKDNWR